MGKDGHSRFTHVWEVLGGDVARPHEDITILFMDIVGEQGLEEGRNA